MSARSAPPPPPRVLVIEDGLEYSERFSRLLGAQFVFARAASFAEAVAALEGIDALILDLDFRRTPRERLIDGAGARIHEDEAAALAPVQGILILRALRARGVALPAVLCADLDDGEQTARLCEELEPLQLSPSSEGLPALAARLRALIADCPRA